MSSTERALTAVHLFEAGKPWLLLKLYALRAGCKLARGNPPTTFNSATLRAEVADEILPTFPNQNPTTQQKEEKIYCPWPAGAPVPSGEGQEAGGGGVLHLQREPSIALRFEDKTELRFGIEPGFTMFADYADWTTGNHRPIREWRAVRSKIFRE